VADRIRLTIAATQRPARNERANSQLRRLCQGRHNRKNYLSAGADSRGERATAIYSLIGTVKLNEVGPDGYLRFVRARIENRSIQKCN
jgi:hypothetical protein